MVWGPFLEEVLFRGFALQGFLEAGSTFWRANLESTGVFTLLHVPGWLFLGHSLPECFELGLRVGFLGLLFGALRAGGASLWPSAILHAANNAWRGGWFLLAIDRLKEGLVG